MYKVWPLQSLGIFVFYNMSNTSKNPNIKIFQQNRPCLFIMNKLSSPPSFNFQGSTIPLIMMIQTLFKSVLYQNYIKQVYMNTEVNLTPNLIYMDINLQISVKLTDFLWYMEGFLETRSQSYFTFLNSNGTSTIDNMLVSGQLLSDSIRQ